MEYGKIYITERMIQAMIEDGEFHTSVLNMIFRYIAGDWGEMCESDKRLNDNAVKDGDRVVAAYESKKGKVYIITEWDRSVTTVLFADEY